MNRYARTTMRSAGRPNRSRPSAPGTLRQLGDAHWEMRIPRELKSPNKTLWAHWRMKQAERQAWEQELLLTIAGYAGMTTAAGAQLLRSRLSLFVPADVSDPAKPRLTSERRRVVITRLVPSSRNFIKDDDNLAFAPKPVFDAMKRVGLIFEDKREWLDAPRPTQAVSPDGTYTTVIEITRLGTTALKSGGDAAGGLL